jgi:hypothetical protein
MSRETFREKNAMSRTIARVLVWVGVALAALVAGAVALLWVALQSATFG